MAFQSDQRIKVQIITTLGADQIFRLLSDSDINIVMKTLGLLRNVVAHKSQIDHVMSLFGKHIMQVNMKIHIFKISILTKFTLSKSHF